MTDQRPFRIYMITFPDGRGYIGCTRQFVDQRIASHIAAVNSQYGYPANGVTDAIARYGVDGMAWAQIASASNADDAAELETALIAQNGTFGSGGYNLRARSAVPRQVRTVRSRFAVSRPVVRDWLRVKTTKCKAWPPKRAA